MWSEGQNEPSGMGKKLQAVSISIPIALRGTLSFITAYSPPRNNLYANKAVHMVCAVCSSAGKIFNVVSEFCGSQMFFNL